jgi:hypothetical protein
MPQSVRHEKMTLKMPLNNKAYELIPHRGQPWCKTQIDLLLCAIFFVLQKETEPKKVPAESDVELLRNLLIKRLCEGYLDNPNMFKKKYNANLCDYVNSLVSPLEGDRPKHSF